MKNKAQAIQALGAIAMLSTGVAFLWGWQSAVITVGVLLLFDSYVPTSTRGDTK